jgi:hypothetical protein
MAFDLQPTLKGDLLELRPLRPEDFDGLYAVAAIENDALIQEAPAIFGCRTPSALAHAGAWPHPCMASGPGRCETALPQHREY